MIEGGNLFIYDPKVNYSQIEHDLNKNMSTPENFTYSEGNWFQSSNIYDATENADAVVILTEWEEFKNLNWQKITNNMRSPSWIFDTRYLLNPEDISKLDINYWRIGYGDQMIDGNKDL